MPAYELKTRHDPADVESFLRSLENDTRRRDSITILHLMKEITGMEPEMWDSSIVGFGSYHYKYETGHEGDMPLIGFSPRKQAMTLYIIPGINQYDDLLARLDKHKRGKSCLYLNKLADVDVQVLEVLMRESFLHMKSRVENN
ncbi:DUF1801 domain-containing protein [Candidatus Neomarinimicrobiota bacterium]